MRQTLQILLEKDTQSRDVLRDNQQLRDKAHVLQSNVQMHLPIALGDYTDFFVGLHHAMTVSNDQIEPLGAEYF